MVTSQSLEVSPPHLFDVVQLQAKSLINYTVKGLTSRIPGPSGIFLSADESLLNVSPGFFANFDRQRDFISGSSDPDNLAVARLLRFFGNSESDEDIL